MGKGRGPRAATKHKSKNIPKRRCMKYGCNHLAKQFEYDDNNKIKFAWCKNHRR